MAMVRGCLELPAAEQSPTILLFYLVYVCNSPSFYVMTAET